MNIVLNAYLTWKCNFECAHCCHECGPHGNHMSELNIDYIFNFLEWLYTKNITPVVLGITGGEPTIHPLFWKKIMPRLKDIKNKYRLDNIELHSNASVPIPKEQYGNYTGFFNNVYVGHDIFHNKFRKLSELDIAGYTEITKSMRVGNVGMACLPSVGYVQCIREKGRAKNLDPSKYETVPIPGTPCVQCMAHTNQHCLQVSFTPDHINFCGEKSHPLEGDTTGEGQFLPYTTPYEDLLAASIKYDVLYSNRFCSQPCIAKYVREKNNL